MKVLIDTNLKTIEVLENVNFEEISGFIKTSKLVGYSLVSSKSVKYDSKISDSYWGGLSNNTNLHRNVGAEGSALLDGGLVNGGFRYKTDEKDLIKG